MAKKYLATKLKNLNMKMRKTSVIKGLRVFDPENPFVDLEKLNFAKAWAFLKTYYQGNKGLEATGEGDKRKTDGIKVNKFHLNYQGV